MSEFKLEFVGKEVKDMYGTFMGKVVGVITDIDGSIESVGVDCGSSGLNQLAYEQLLVQGDYVIYIPRWRLDAQNLLRQKNLTLQRIKALQEMVAVNDLMKDDAELVYIKYQKRLRDLEEKEKTIIELLQERLNQLDAENKNIKSVLFDAKLQYRSSELTEETYQQISIHTNDLIEHINLEKAEINNVKMRLTQQTLDNVDLAINTSHQKSPGSTYTESSSKIETSKQNETAHIIVADEGKRTEEKAVQGNTNNNETDENSWLNHVIQNE
jgi:CdvA-like coiled-coil domain